MLDSVEVLLSHAAVLGAAAPLRCLYEAMLSVEWMLEADSTIRAKRFYVQNLRSEQTSLNRCVSGTDENAAFSHVFDAVHGLESRVAPREQEMKDRIHEIEQFLNSPTYKAINSEFNQARGKMPYDADWFKLGDGPKSIRSIADKLGNGALAEYDV